MEMEMEVNTDGYGNGHYSYGKNSHGFFYSALAPEPRFVHRVAISPQLT